MKRFISILILFFINSFYSTVYPLINDKNNILIITSYHKGFSYTDRFIIGIESFYRRETDYKSNVFVEYLNFSRLPQSPSQKKDLAKYLEKRYEKLKIDALVAVDPEALLFIDEYSTFFNNDKCFFCGFPEEFILKLKNKNKYIGLKWDYDFKVNFNYAKKLFPNRNEFIILIDTSILGDLLYKNIKNIEKDYKDKTFIYIRDYSFDELFSFLSSRENTSILFPILYSFDKYKNLYLLEELTSIFSNKTNIPIFGYIDYLTNRGIIGGYLQLGFKHGNNLAKIISEYIENNTINDSLLNVKYKYNTIFNYERLVNFKIPFEKIPQNATIIDRPQNYYEKYFKVLIPYLIVIISLLIFVILLVINIKKRKILSQKLKESEALYRLMINNSKDIIFRFDYLPYQHFVFISPSIKEILKIDPETLYNDFSIIYNYVVPEYLNFIQDLLSDNNKINFNNIYEIKWNIDNKELWTEDKYMPIYDKNNNLMAIEAVSRDITQRKEYFNALKISQDRLKLVLESNKDGIYDWNIKTGEIMTDDRWLEMLNYKPNEIKFTYEMWVKALHEDDRDHTLKLLQEHLSGKTEYYEVEYRLQTKNNNYKWILSRGKVVEKDLNGNPIRMTGTHTDITQKKQNEIELLKMKKLESVGTLAAGIAHEFNNILTAILGNISLSKILLFSNKDIDKINTLIANSEKAVFRAKELTQKLLYFSKGGKPIKIITNLKEIINDTLLLFNEPQIKYELKIIPKLWNIEADPSQLKQALHSIISNSIEAMNRKGEIKIIAKNYRVNRSVSNIPYLQNDYYIKIEIIDEGCGIDDQYIDKIFDPFFTTKSQASGLGLSSASAIIHNHEGNISVSSKPQKGTIVTIYLPAVIEKDFIQEEIQTKSLTTKAKILVMDDEESIRELLSEALTSFGFSVTTTADGNEAISKYLESLESGSPYDLIILDLTIPGGKGGKDTIEELLKIDNDVKAIVSSGYSNDPILSNYTKYGFKGIIKKPYDIDTLENTVKKILS